MQGNGGFSMQSAIVASMSKARVASIAGTWAGARRLVQKLFDASGFARALSGSAYIDVE
jgi:hypothetical protein